MEVVSSQDSLGIAMIHHGNTSTKMFVCWFNPASDRWLAVAVQTGKKRVKLLVVIGSFVTMIFSSQGRGKIENQIADNYCGH